MTAVRIRDMTDDDLAAVALLSDQLGYPATLAQLEPRLDHLRRSGDEALLVAELDDGTVAGWIHVGADPSLTHDGVAEIKGLVVSGDRRGQGLGRELVVAAEDWCLRRGFRIVRVRSRVEREAAHGFYKSRGYLHQKTQHVFSRKLT
jgi:GNAT superfamily N-acetyltransferase